MEADGILELDFLTKFKSTIDYDTWTLAINSSNDLHEIPIFDGPEVGTILVPPSCEIIRELHVKITTDTL